MKKIFLLLFISLFSITCVPNKTSKTPAQREYVRDLINRAVKIRSVFLCDGEEKKSSGTGVIWRSYRDPYGSYIITAAHVVSHEGCRLKELFLDRYNADNIKYFSARAEVRKVDKDKDLALLKTDKNLGVNTFIVRSIYLGMKVHSLGFPLTLRDYSITRPIYTEGVIAGTNYSKGYLRVTSTIFFGNSGGGVYDSQGNLVGVSVLLYTYNGHREYYIVGPKTIKEFLSGKN